MKKHIVISLFLSTALAASLNTVVAQGYATYTTHRDMARALVDSGKHSEAIKAYNLAIAQMPYSNRLIAERGMAKMKVGDYPGAVSDFDFVLTNEPYIESVNALRQEALQKINTTAASNAPISHHNADTPEYQNTLPHGEASAKAWRRHYRNQLIWGTAVPMAAWSLWWWAWWW